MSMANRIAKTIFDYCENKLSDKEIAELIVKIFTINDIGYFEDGVTEFNNMKDWSNSFVTRFRNE